MPRKLPTEHRHEFPGERGSPIEHDAPFECQNEVVIKDILRRLSIVESLSNQIQKIDNRLRVIEDRPAPLIPKVPDNDAVQIPRAFGEFFDRVLILEKQLLEIKSEQSVVAADGSGDLAEAVSDLTATAMKMFGILQGEVELIRRRVNKLDNDQMELVSGLRDFARLNTG